MSQELCRPITMSGCVNSRANPVGSSTNRRGTDPVRGWGPVRPGERRMPRGGFFMSWRIGGGLAVLAALMTFDGVARAAHCGACCYPTQVVSQEQCCVPEVRYRVCYQEVWED